MREFIIMGVAAIVVFSASYVHAGDKGREMSDAHASEEAIFHRVGDWFATIGKSDEEKAKIKAERKTDRMKAKATKKADKAKTEVEGKAKEMKKNMDKKMKGSDHKGS